MKRLFLLCAVTVLAACSGGSNPVSLSARTGAPLRTAATTPAPAATGLQVTRLRVSLSKIELRTADGTKSAGMNTGPVVLDLSGADLDGGVHKVLDAQIPPGTYKKIEIDIEPSTALGGASIVVNGTFNGTAFEYSSKLHAEQEHEGTFTITGQSANITLNLDPASWFVAGGVTLNPTDPKNGAAIEANLANAIEVFEDDDHSGRDDNQEGEHDGGDGEHDDGEHGDAGHPDGGPGPAP